MTSLITAIPWILAALLAAIVVLLTTLAVILSRQADHDECENEVLRMTHAVDKHLLVNANEKLDFAMFKCVTCGKFIDKGSERFKNNKPYCQSCHNSMIMEPLKQD